MEISVGRRLRAKLVPSRATVTGRAELAESLVELWCAAPAPFDPGQVLAVRVDGTGPGPTGTWRRYTIAATDGLRFRLIVQRNPDGAAAHLVDTVTAGDTVTIRGPERAVLPPVGDSPLLVVADLTGLATIAALAHQDRGDGRPHRIGLAVLTSHLDVDSSIIADAVGVDPEEITMHRDREHLAGWFRDRSMTGHATPRVLALGEHELTRVARQAALEVGVPAAQVRTRTYWKPGRRGLE